MAAFEAVLVPALLTWGAAMSRWIDALHKLVEVGMDLTANLSLEVVLQKVVDRAGQIAQARYAALGVLDETTGKLGRFLAAGVDPETYAKIGRPPEVMAGVLGELLGDGKTLRLKDLTLHPKFSGFPPHHPAGRSFLGVPIRYQDQILGDLYLMEKVGAEEFSEEDEAILTAFAAQAALAIQNARAYDQLQRYHGLLKALYRASMQVQEPLGLEERLDGLLQAARDVLRLDRCNLLLADAEGKWLTAMASLGTDEPLEVIRVPIGPEGGGIAQAYLTQRAIAWDGRGPVPEDLRLKPPYDRIEAFRSRVFAIVPLVVQGRAIGVLGADRKHSRQPFDAPTLELLQPFATHAAIAIENARLFAATQRAAREARSLYEVAHSLTNSLDVTEVLHLIAVKTTELLGTPHAQVVLWDEASQTLRLGASYGTEAERVRAQEFRLGEGVNGIVAQTRAPLIVNDYQAFPQRVPWLTELVAVIGVPLLYRDRLLGVLTSHATRPGSVFTEEHLALLSSFADQAAAATENARLYDGERRRALELQTVMEVSRDVIGQRPLDAFLQDVVGRAVAITRAHSGTLYLWDGKEELLRPQAWVNLGDYMRDVRYPLGRGITGTAAAKGRGVIWNEYTSHPHHDPKLLQHVALMACMAAPLKIRDQLIGVLTLNADEPGRHFSPADLTLLETFASQMAVAIENARLYEEKRFAAIQLEAMVEERTRELQEARHRAEEASRHKSEFLSNMSHELRTPLNAVIGFSELLLGQGVGPLTEKQARYLGHIHNSGKHLLQLISDILDLSKVEAGKIVLQPERLPVAATLEDILVIARGLAKKWQIVEADIEPDLPPLRADPVRFKQILFNLLSNAVKFTPEGGTITVRAYQKAEGRRQKAEGSVQTSGELPPLPTAECPLPTAYCLLPSLVIEVTDTGIGIKPEDLPRLFQEFVQIETSATKRNEGTGLGLALTKRLVELHGGRIWAESGGEGRGSTFMVMLPFAAPQA